MPYWTAFVANLQMHGKGTFVDARLNDAGQFPVAAAAGFADVRSQPDPTIASSASASPRPR